MDRKIVVMLTVSDDDDLPNIVQLDQPESKVIAPLIRALIRHYEELEERPPDPPGWTDYIVDGYSFSLKPDGNGGLTVTRNYD